MAESTTLVPESQFPKEALQESVQVQPKPKDSSWQGGFLTIGIASAADLIVPWGRNVKKRDRELRDFWPTESYLAGAVLNVSFRNAAFDWEIKSKSDPVVTALTDMLTSAIAGDTFGWVPFMQRLSQDLYTQDNGAMIELIRDPGMDANSKFKNDRAPVIGIAHLDSNQCTRTGNAEIPIIYTDRDSKQHKLHWYEVIAMADFPSAIETMNGVGYSAVTRALRLAQIMRSIALFKDEKIGGRHFKSIHLVSGVSRTELDDAKTRGRAEADNLGQLRYIDPVILASLDPEKPVSVASIDLAALPEGFDIDQEMQWYIAGLALDFGVDYQEFAPLPGGNIGSSAQSIVLHKKSSGKGPRVFMRTLVEAFKNYGVLPRGTEMIFNDKNEQEEMEKQEIRTKAMEEAAISVRSGILTPDAARKDLVRRGIYEEATIEGIEESYGEDIVAPKQNLGDTGGNTLADDASRTNTGKPSQTAGARLRKIFGG